MLSNIHSHLSLKSYAYRTWHKFPFHPHIHWGIFGLFSTITSLKVLASILAISFVTLPGVNVLAATQTWTSQSDWNGWTKTNTSETVTSGSLTLSSASSSQSWSTATSPTSNQLNGVWGSSASDIWAIGNSGTIIHYDGASWTSATSPTSNTLRSLWGSSASDIWAVGDSGTIAHYNGSAWSTATSPTSNQLNGVWGSSASDIWAIGNSGTIIHYDGASWTSATSPTVGTINAIWGASASDIWAVGSSNLFIHYNGSSWSTTTSGAATTFLAIWGTSGSDIWTGGGNGLIRHYDGASWSNVASPISGSDFIRGIIGFSSSDVWAVSDNGKIIHYDGVSWTSATSPTSNHLKAVWGSSATNIVAVGAGGTITQYSETITYDSSGTATKNFDATAATTWNSLTKAETLNSQTINYYAASDTDTTCPSVGGATSGSWTSGGWTALSFTGNVASLSSLSASRYLCIGTYLATTDTALTPSIESLALDYDVITVSVTAPTASSCFLVGTGSTIPGCASTTTGTTTNITWTSTGASGGDHIRIKYASDGTAFSDISGATALTKTDTSYTWTLPTSTKTTTAKVKVILEDASNVEITSSTSGAFTIHSNSTPAVSPTLPVDGSTI